VFSPGAFRGIGVVEKVAAASPGALSSDVPAVEGRIFPRSKIYLGVQMAPTAKRRLAGSRQLILGTLVLAGLVILVYFPALKGGFIWDDDDFLTQNPLISAPDGLRRLWLTAQSPDYWPLTYTTLWLEWRIWGMNAAGYHATNVLMHIAESLILWAILRRLRIPGAFLAALFFALHPVNVESVAWITQRKNLVAMLFFLLSILCFLETDPGAPPGPIRPGLGRWYVFSLLAFALAMLGKGSVAPLPVVLLGITWWHRRIVASDWIRISPFFAVAATLTAANIWFQSHSYVHFRNAGFVERMLGAAAALWFYAGKAIWPANLCFIYPQWSIHMDDIRWWIPLLAAVGATAGLWGLGRRTSSVWGRAAFFAWLYFCVMLAPVLGFTDVAFMLYSLVADHYQHLALIAVTTLAAAGLVSWVGRLPPLASQAGLALCALIAGLLGALTMRQSGTYRDSQTLYTTTIERNPGCWLAQNNLANDLAKIPGRMQEALAHYEEALRINPNYAKAHNNLANALAAIPGRMQEAISHYEEALRIDPNFAEAHINLANSLMTVPGRTLEAVSHYEEALRINPGFAEAHYNLADALVTIPGRDSEALAHFEEALRINPNFAEAQYNVGLLCAKMGRFDEAIAHWEMALKLDPTLTDARDNLNELRAMRR
jgi:tetratricopeptide (TPR) repeat protein